ncbi:DNA oxidative demethylase AlkB [Undibacterium sp. TJN19]|uniref:DNA oxidative demethylase AlkB n=1 Tax=Undibacterium sp. TJN19 TaxID=3413055 RepID=UPI003BF028A6
MNYSLFDDASEESSYSEALCEGAAVLRHFASAYTGDLLAEIEKVIATHPFRHMRTPSGLRMSVATSCCGSVGWVSDQDGYRYSHCEPESSKAWPPMPETFLSLAKQAAAATGFHGFAPDSCLINQYVAGTRLGLHQDKDEKNLNAPIVSVSLGIPATFLFGGLQRSDPQQRIYLAHGDVVVWGGPARLRFHGITPIKPAAHPLLGAQRINLTFRQAR